MCKNCKNSTYKRENDGSVRLKCNDDFNGTGVCGFHECINYEPKTTEQTKMQK
jgi:hypothetical protein